jgi:hypothetical protein
MIALLSQDELISLLGRNGIPIPQSSMFGDSVYLSLTKHSLLGSVAADHRDYCVAMRLDEYVEMANDCEDFSLQFVMRAKADAVNALLTRRITARAGMAVGMVWYGGWRYGSHSIVVAACFTGDASEWGLLSPAGRMQRVAEFWEVIHIEPQFRHVAGGMAAEVVPTEEEKKTCFGLLFV